MLERLRSNRSPRPERCDRAANVRGEIGTDATLVMEIREVVSSRASYGYRRVTAMLNRARGARSEQRVNHKREHVRDMMVHAVERRFGEQTRQLPCDIEWLSDNGSTYRSDETRSFGEGIGFTICTTPPYSPESNGMAESFVKSFKRNYVYLADLLVCGRGDVAAARVGRRLQPRTAPPRAENAVTH